jgi:hypothetical protein
MQEEKEATESSSTAESEDSSEADTMPRKLVVTAAVALAVVFLVVVFIVGADSHKTFWDYLDLIIVPAVLVIGGYLLDQAQQDRERKAENARRKRELDVEKQRAENEYRKEFLMHILGAYNGAKKVRRVLAAHRSDDEKIPCSVYEAQMEALMDAQLELEIYKPDKREGPPNALLPAFENETKTREISARVSELEKYLKNIIEDYDKGYKGRYAEVKKKLGLNGPSSQMPLQCLPDLHQFIETKSFRKEFARPVHKLQKQVKEEIERPHSNGAK